MKRLITEKIKVCGEVPSARFGHTFTMVASNKAVLFGGAVSQGGTFQIRKANLSSLTKLIYMISLFLSGVNLILSMILYLLSVQPMQQ